MSRSVPTCERCAGDAYGGRVTCECADGGVFVDPLDADTYAAKLRAMHRRAQRAEGNLARLLSALAYGSIPLSGMNYYDAWVTKRARSSALLSRYVRNEPISQSVASELVWTCRLDRPSPESWSIAIGITALGEWAARCAAYQSAAPSMPGNVGDLAALVRKYGALAEQSKSAAKRTYWTLMRDCAIDALRARGGEVAP